MCSSNPVTTNYIREGTTKILLIAISCTACLVKQSTYKAGYLDTWLIKKKKKKIMFLNIPCSWMWPRDYFVSKG